MIPKTISVVIPTHNRAHSLIRLLNSFNNQRRFPKKIIIINDASNDKTKKILKEWEAQKHDFIPKVFNNPNSQGSGGSSKYWYSISIWRRNSFY